MDFIDTHQHLIYRREIGYGWTDTTPELATGDFTLSDYRALSAGRGIGGTVFMETGVDDADYQKEARFVGGLVGQEGLLGQIASCRPEQDAGFDAWLEEGADLHVKGYRRILHVMPDALSQTEAFRQNLRKIGAKGVAFDMCFLARQLDIAEQLARACDDQVLVLDHCGVPDIAGGEFEPWAKSITRLSALAHVRVKLSGISAYCAPGAATCENLRPWVDHIIHTFGPSRVVWGSDWPVVNLGVGLPDWVDMTRRLIAGLTEAEQQQIASGTAKATYRLS